MFDSKLSSGVCPKGFTKLFTKEWAGIQESCSCIQEQIELNNADLNQPTDYAMYLTSGQKCSDKCQKISGVEAVEQHPIKGKLICGKNGQTTIEKMVKPINLKGNTCDIAKMKKCPGI
jgi:hypothetical protein